MNQNPRRAAPNNARPPTAFQQSIGPSCLLSLIIVFLLLLVLRRFLQFGLVGVAVVTFVVWFGVFSLLLRWRPLPVEPDEEPEPPPAEIPENVIEGEWWDPDQRGDQHRH